MNKTIEKSRIRRKYLQYRNSLPEQQVKMKSSAISAQLKTFDLLRDVAVVHCYISIAERGEVDTFGIIQWLLKDEIQVAVPKSDFETKEMQHFLLTNPGSLVKNHLGIMEPTGGVEVPDSRLDLVIVPMVAADRNKNRLGYGEGFYDRFLAKVNAVKVGLVYEECLMDHPIPVEEFDVPMDYLITEKRIL